MKYGFEYLLYEIPTNKVEIEALSKEAGFGQDIIDKITANGLRRVPVNNEGTLDRLVNKAVKKLLLMDSHLCERIQYIILSHSLPVLAPASIPFLSRCIEGCNLEEKPVIALGGQPCSIIHTEVQLAISSLKNEDIGKGVLFIGADQVNSAEERIFFGSTMGDAVVVGFLSNDSYKNIILASVTETDIIAYDGEISPKEDIERFRSENHLNIRHAIESALEEAHLKLTDIKYIFPHTANRLIWDVVAKILRYPRENIIDRYIIETGHLNSNDSFCHYIRACEEGLIDKGDKAVLINPGFGGTRGCTIVEA